MSKTPILKIIFIILTVMTMTTSLQSNNPSKGIREETVSYMLEGVIYQGFVAYNESVKGKRPVVIVIHEWWGLNDYAKNRARELARLGYFALAADLFGEGRTATNPAEAQAFTKQFYQDPRIIKGMMDAAIAKAKEYPQADPENVAAIGYCFGGFVVLNAAKLGVGFRGVVSFHGGLGGVTAEKELLKAKILVCHGGSDNFVTPEDIASFMNQMDSIGAGYTFKTYPGATHAFTNPDATEAGQKFNLPIEYNAEADKNSWNDMKSFFEGVFWGR